MSYKELVLTGLNETLPEAGKTPGLFLHVQVTPNFYVAFEKTLVKLGDASTIVWSNPVVVGGTWAQVYAAIMKESLDG